MASLTSMTTVDSLGAHYNNAHIKKKKKTWLSLLRPPGAQLNFAPRGVGHSKQILLPTWKLTELLQNHSSRPRCSIFPHLSQSTKPPKTAVFNYFPTVTTACLLKTPPSVSFFARKILLPSIHLLPLLSNPWTFSFSCTPLHAIPSNQSSMACLLNFLTK